jgi:hypothetical protein
VIKAFGPQDTIDLSGFIFNSQETESFVPDPSHNSGMLTVVDGSKQANLALLGTYTTGNFALSNDGVGGTLIKYV